MATSIDTSVLKGKKIVVTGGAGFIGSHIVDALLSYESEVVVIDDLSTGRDTNISHAFSKITFMKGSILDTALLEKAFQGAYAVIHEAALPSVPKSIALPIETHQANSTGTLSIFVTAQKCGVKRVVYASSSSVYGNSPTLPKVETMQTGPLSPYAVQKLTTELYGKIFYELFGLETVGLRYFNVFGPRQDPSSAYAAVIPKFVSLIKKGESPKINGDGEHTRDFTYVANVVHANICGVLVPSENKSAFGTAYNVASGGQVSLNELVKKINILLGTTISPDYLSPRAGDIKDSFADIDKAKGVLGYDVLVDFDTGLKNTIDSL
jgi:nucleoside-diphosphate-sugar epimerase